MRLDDADLALLEIDADKLEPLARDIVRTLVDAIREQREWVEVAERERDKARDHASDAKLALDKMRFYLKEAPIEAENCADDIERELEQIERGP